jgi:hypothetical protein
MSNEDIANEHNDLFLRVAARLERLTGPNSAGWFHACCPACGSKPSSLGILPTDNGFVVKCFKGGCTWPEIQRALEDRPALRDAKTLCAPVAVTGEEGDASSRAKGIWLESVPAGGTLAEDYLRSRGIGLAPPVVLRFHARLGYARGAAAPALVALVQAPDGRPTAIQRTWLQPPVFGMKVGKARFIDGAVSKKSLGPCRGGAVRLFPPDARGRLALAEGIETALSFTQLRHIPCWAGLGGNLGGVELPDDVREVVLAVDNDVAGERYVQILCKRFAHLEVSVARPERAHKDWNDALHGGRRGK